MTPPAERQAAPEPAESPLGDRPASATVEGPISTSLDASGVLLATIDMAGRTMNVFSVELMDALDALMDRVDADPAVQSCVVTSAKPTFLAGADLVMVRGYCDAAKTASRETMFAMCGRLGRQFVRMEASAKPFVAAVNGLALGGGLELALACRLRLVADDPRLQLGVPEVRWGLLPGAGGTQRLPRLAGMAPALDLLLSGRSIDPATAFELGIVSSVVPANELLEAAKAAARGLHGTPCDPALKFRHLDQADVPPADADTARALAMKHGVSADDHVQYPAYVAIVQSVLQGARLPLAEATAVEMLQFLRLMFDPVAGRMVRTLFLERLRAERELAPADDIGVERLRVGPLDGAWAAALSKLKLPQHSDATLPPATLAVTDRAGAEHIAQLQVLGETMARLDGTQLLLSPAGPYGRVVEIVGASDGAAAVFAALAMKLRALPWRTHGAASRLAALHGRSLPEQARLAGGWAGSDTAFLDVAACLSGVSPAWSGGPLTWQANP